MEFKPIVIKKTFDEIEKGDLILYSSIRCGIKINEFAIPVKKVGYTILHKHKYVVIEEDECNRKYYKDDHPTPFSVIIMKAQKSTGHNIRKAK